MNKVCLVGRLTKDIEARHFGEGKVANFSLAVRRRFKTGDGLDADFIECVAWNKTVDYLEKYTHKGNQIGLEGRIQVRNYDNKDGRKVYVTEVIVENVELLESKAQRVDVPEHEWDKDRETRKGTKASQPQNNGANEFAYGKEAEDLNIDSDVLPF